MSADMTFTAQINKVIAKASQRAGWILRTFRNRSPELLRTLWRSLVEPHLDYCSQLWSPADSTLINSLEAPLRAYSKRIYGAAGLSYWGRLKLLKLSSTQRRHDRYKILYCFKILNGLVPNPGLTLNALDSRKGPTISGPQSRCGGSTHMKTLKDNSFLVSGPAVFNCLPKNVRSYSSHSLEVFKFMLDSYLNIIPDYPYSLGTGSSSAVLNDGTPFNSIRAHVRGHPRDLLEWKAPDISHF